MDVKQRSGRVWVATLAIPPNTGIDAEFFAAFPQKHQVVVGLGNREDEVLMALISTDLHSLGTVVRKIQNTSITSGSVANLRFEMLEAQIESLLQAKGGSFKMTTTRPSFEDLFKTALCPSLYGMCLH